jgi:hypothetical protein
MEVNITYFTSPGEVESETVVADESGYILSPASYFVNIVSEQDVYVKANEVKLIEIREIQIPENQRLTLLDRYRHALGVLVAVAGKGKPAKVESLEKVTHAVFLPLSDGKICRGELLGVGVLTAIKKEKKEVIVEKLQEFDKAISIDPEVFIKSDWPYLWSKK